MSFSCSLKAQDLTIYNTYEQIDSLVTDYYNKDQIEKAVYVLEYAKLKFENDLYKIISKLTLYYPKINQFDRLMDVWEYGQSKGLFFPARYKRYEPLFETARYQKFLKENDRLKKEAAKKTRAEYCVVLPDKYDLNKKYPVLISLHGDNNNNTSFKKFWKLKKYSNEYIVVFFQSSQLSGTNRYVWEDKEIGKRDVVELYEKLKDNYNIDESKLYIGGFSSGGAVSLDAAVKNTIPVKGFITLCPAGITFTEADSVNLTRAVNRNIKGYIIAGEKDIFALHEQRINAALFDAVGLDYKMITIIGMGHTYPKDLDEQLDIAIDFITSEKEQKK